MSSKGMLYNIKHKCYYAMHSYIGLGSGAPMAMGTKLKYNASQRLNMLKKFPHLRGNEIVMLAYIAQLNGRLSI